MHWLIEAVSQLGVHDLAALVSAAAASLAALVACAALLRSGRNLREQLRPVVVAELQKHPYGRWDIELVVTNYGQTPARDVRVTFCPALVDPSPSTPLAETLTAALVRRFAKEISVLAPKAEIRQIYYTGDKKPGVDVVVNTEPTPDQINVRVKYRGQGRWRPYTDKFQLDIRLIAYSSTIGSKDNPASQRRVIADGIAKLAEIKHWPT